jgi:hypothetical protein
LYNLQPLSSHYQMVVGDELAAAVATTGRTASATSAAASTTASTTSAAAGCTTTTSATTGRATTTSATHRRGTFAVHIAHLAYVRIMVCHS